MAGYNLFVISGIDGCFDEFDGFYENRLVLKPTQKLQYDRNQTFIENVAKMRQVINSFPKLTPKVIVGWSIGAAAAAFLSDCNSVETCIMINSFYCRKEVLKRRNIECDEDVCLEDSYRLAPCYVIIRGELDDKIPPIHSDRIRAMYPPSVTEFHSFPLAKHNISSFPIEKIASIINNKIK